MTKTLRAFVRAATGRTGPPGGTPGPAVNSTGEMTDSEMAQITGGYEGPGDYNVSEWMYAANRRTATRIVRALRWRNRGR